MNKLILFLMLGVFIIPFVSSSLSEELDSFTITDFTINDYNSTLKFTIDTEGKDFDRQTITFGEYTLENVYISDILNGINGDVLLEKNNLYPTYNSLTIQGAVPIALVQDALWFLEDEGYNVGFTVDDINANPGVLNYLIEQFNLNKEYDRTTHIIKNGKEYTIYMDKGYKSLGNDYLSNILSILDETSYFVKPIEVVEWIAPIIDLSSYLNLVSWDTEILPNDLVLESGEYHPKILINGQYEKIIPLTLNIVNEQPSIIPDENGTIKFTNPVIMEILTKIEGLPQGIELNLSIYGSSLPSGWVSTPSTIEKTLKYFEINVNQSISGSFDIYFSVDKTETSDYSLIRLFVYENSWVELPTTYLNSDSKKYYFKGTTTHFSNFMIGEKKVTTNGGSSGGGGNGISRRCIEGKTRNTYYCTDGITISSKEVCKNRKWVTLHYDCPIEERCEYGLKRILVYKSPFCNSVDYCAYLDLFKDAGWTKVNECPKREEPITPTTPTPEKNNSIAILKVTGFILIIIILILFIALIKKRRKGKKEPYKELKTKKDLDIELTEPPKEE